jgi:hypothetical protein
MLQLDMLPPVRACCSLIRTCCSQDRIFSSLLVRHFQVQLRPVGGKYA